MLLVGFLTLALLYWASRFTFYIEPHHISHISSSILGVQVDLLFNDVPSVIFCQSSSTNNLRNHNHQLQLKNLLRFSSAVHIFQSVQWEIIENIIVQRVDLQNIIVQRIDLKISLCNELIDCGTHWFLKCIFRSQGIRFHSLMEKRKVLFIFWPKI